jgi:hypothetical protein
VNREVPHIRFDLGFAVVEEFLLNVKEKASRAMDFK